MNIRIWTLRVLLGVVVLCGILVGVLLLTFDPNDLKSQIVKAVRDNTGRELIISGDLDLEFFPYLSVSIKDVELGNSQGFNGPFLTLTGAHLKTRLLPLLSSRLDVVAIDIEGLSLFLARDASGRGNWMDLATPASPDGSVSEEPVLARDKRIPFLASLIVDGLQVSDARIVWDDQRSGENFEVGGIRLDVSDFAFGVPFVVDTYAMAKRGEITGELDFSAEATLELDRLSVANLAMKAVLSGDSLPGSPETISLAADFFSTDGRIDNGRMLGLGLDVGFSAQASSGEDIVGVLDVARFNPKEAFTRLGLPAPHFTDPSALEEVAFSCRLTKGNEGFEASNLKLVFDDQALKGRVAVYGRTDPQVDLELHLDTLNLDRYRIHSGSGENQASSGPSEENLDLPVKMMRKLNLNATLALDSLTVSNLRVSDARVRLTAKDGIFDMREIESGLYGGRLNGAGSLDVREQTPVYAWSHRISGLQIGPLLRDLHGQESLSGSMQSSADLGTTGRSTMDLRRNLKGKVDFKVSDGAISGVNVSQLLRDGIRKVKGLSPGPQESPRTVFSVLSASGTISNGVETTPDLFLLAPRFRVTGNGQTDLVREVLDFRLLIELAGSQGQFDEGTLGLNSVPVRISGPVREPTISPDMEAVLRDLGLRGGQAVQDVLKGVGSGLNKGVEGLKNIFK
jgi:AsmA protein